MTDPTELIVLARARSVEVRDWPEQDGELDADLLDRLADALEAAHAELTAREGKVHQPEVTTDEREALALHLAGWEAGELYQTSEDAESDGQQNMTWWSAVAHSALVWFRRQGTPVTQDELAQGLFRTLHDEGVSFTSATLIPKLVAAITRKAES